MSGLRPIVDLMFMDFMCVAMDQIVNQAAKALKSVPIVESAYTEVAFLSTPSMDMPDTRSRSTTRAC